MTDGIIEFDFIRNILARKLKNKITRVMINDINKEYEKWYKRKKWKSEKRIELNTINIDLFIFFETE
jgi:hypothetical protein